MSESNTQARDGLHEHTRRLKDEYPEPLCYLLIELSERNREYWLTPPMDNTLGADEVRETGLTSNQQEWADQLAGRLFDRGDRDTLERALETWGRGTQEVLAIEELSELTTALARMQRGRADSRAVIDEIADALIVINQLAVIYGLERVEARTEEKLARLEDRLEAAEGDSE